MCGLMALSAALPAALAAENTIVRVPTLGGSQVDVRALNNAGAIVGFSRTANNEQHAFYYRNGVMQDLGTLGGAVSLATGLNENGDVICDSDTPDFWQHAARYRGGTLLDLGVLPGGSFSTAIAINDAGDVAGQGDTGDFSIRGFLFRNGQLTDIGSLGGGYSFVTDMNGNGDIVGESWNSFYESHAFVFRSAMMTDLGTLGGTSSKAWAINDSGVIVGESTDANGNTRAFRYSAGSMQDLGTLGGSAAAAYAVNNNGDVLGDSLIAGDVDYHAFLFTGGRLLDLGTLGGSYSSSVALNNLGHVVGDAEDATGRIVPFLWRDGTMVDLNTLLPPDSGWVVYSAYYINDADQIVGFGTHNGQFAWYILTLATANQPPVANAGADQTVECGSMTHLDGSASSDPDSDPLTFEWRAGTMVLGYGATLSVNLGLGTHTLTLTVRDSRDASADDSLTVVVRDSTAPSLACPETHTVATGADCQAAVPDLMSAVVVLDGCTTSSALRKSQTPVVGSMLGLGTHPVVVSVEDASGNVASCTISLTVADVTAPTGDCPPAMTVSAGDDCHGLVPHFTPGLLATDNCTPAAELVKTQSPAAGTKMPVGSHSVTLTVSDAAGNRSMCVTTLHVVDNTAPVISAVSVTPNLIGDDGSMVPITVSVSASDNCGGTPAARILSITSSEPVTSRGDWTSPDWIIGEGLTGQVRAERASNRHGRIYTITVICTDAAGNSSTATTTVTVPGKRGGKLSNASTVKKVSLSTLTSLAKKPKKK